MPELEEKELETTEEVEVVQEDETTDSTESPVESTEQVETPKEETPQESYDSEEQYLSQYNLRSQPKNLDEAMANAKANEAEVNRLQRELAQAREQQNFSKQVVDSPDNSVRFKVQKGRVGEYVKSLISSGQISQDAVTQYNTLARVIDSADDPYQEKLGTYLNQIVGALGILNEQVKSSLWNTFPHKDLAKKKDLDQFLDNGENSDYGQALMQYAIRNNRRDILEKIVSKAEQRVQGKNFQKFQKNTGTRRGAPPAVASTGWNRYLTDTGQPKNQAAADAIARMTTDDALKVFNEHDEWKKKHNK